MTSFLQGDWYTKARGLSEFYLFVLALLHNLHRKSYTHLPACSATSLQSVKTRNGMPAVRCCRITAGAMLATPCQTRSGRRFPYESLLSSTKIPLLVGARRAMCVTVKSRGTSATLRVDIGLHTGIIARSLYIPPTVYHTPYTLYPIPCTIFHIGILVVLACEAIKGVDKLKCWSVTKHDLECNETLRDRIKPRGPKYLAIGSLGFPH